MITPTYVCREPVQRLSVGWRRILSSQRFIAAQHIFDQIDAPRSAKAPARRDGQALDRRLRLESGPHVQNIAQHM